MVTLPRLAFAILLLPFAAPGAPAVTSPSPAATQSAKTWPLPPLDYFVNKMPPPPRTGSFRDRMDLSDAAARQRLVQDEDRKSIQRTYGFTVFTFDSVFGPGFTPKNYPRTAAFFAKLTATAREVVGGLKEHYKRLRPFEGHPDQISLLVRREPGYSYPSGHTTRSRLCALVLGELDPGKRKEINQVAERVGLDRILAGEHYLTDIEGGRKVAKILYSYLNKNPDFRAELAEVKAAEWTHPPSGSKTK